MDKNLSKSVRILASEQIALATMFYSEQVFFSACLINGNVLEWFLPIICKEHLPRSHIAFFLVNEIIMFWLLIKDRQISSTEQLLYQTNKSSHRRCSVKKAVIKKIRNIHMNTPIMESLLQFY